MKTFVLLSILLLISNCSSLNENIVYHPSSGIGCSEYSETTKRLGCIANLVKQLENIQNAKIIVEKKKMDRVNHEYVNYKSIYCFSDSTGKEKYLCFESTKPEYDPTILGIVFDWSKKLGIGGLIGFATGMYISN